MQSIAYCRNRSRWGHLCFLMLICYMIQPIRTFMHCRQVFKWISWVQWHIQIQVRLFPNATIRSIDFTCYLNILVGLC
uniref:Uncharacterized protein n=1 Tax=Arundo donax TaxID=35708 RepID=A0A0A9DLZ3_ARUDO